jgi:hypothetical protein
VRGEHAPIAEQRIENASQAAGESDDGDVCAAARGDVEGPRPEGLRLRRPAAEDGDRGVNQEPAHAGVASLGDPAPALTLPRAELAGHQAQGSLDLVGAAEASNVKTSW